MIFNIQKFKKEIQALGRLNGQRLLHPLKKAQIKQRVLARLHEQPSLRPAFSLRGQGSRLLRYIISLITAICLLGGTALASANSLPGDVLYQVKIAKEKIEIAVAVTQQSRANVETKHAEERLKELEQITAQVQIQTQVEINDNDTGHEQKGDQATATEPSLLEQPLPNQQPGRGSKETSKSQTRAQKQAEDQVGIALDALGKVKARFEAKGNLKAAAGVADSISKLKDRANQQKVKFRINGQIDAKFDGSDDNGIKSNSDQAVTSTPNNQPATSTLKKFPIKNRSDNSQPNDPPTGQSQTPGQNPSINNPPLQDDEHDDKGNEDENDDRHELELEL